MGPWPPGALMVAPDTASALANQPVEGVNTGGAPVRTYCPDSMKSFIVPLNGPSGWQTAQHELPLRRDLGQQDGQKQ